MTDTALELDNDDLAIQEDQLTALSIDEGRALKLVFEEIENAASKILVLRAMETDLKSKVLTAEEIQYVSLAVEMVTNDGVIEHGVLSAENIATRIAKGIAKLFVDLHMGLKKFADYTQYFFTVFNLQETRISRLERKLQSVNGRNRAEIRVGVNKYLMHGRHKYTVEDEKDYLRQYTALANTIVPLLKNAGEFTENDLFSSLKFYKDYIFNEPDDFIMDQFEAMETYLTRAKAGIPLNSGESTPTMAEYSTDPLLGLSRLVVRLPRPNTYKRGNIATILDASRHFYMYVDRQTKINFGTMFEGSVNMSLNKQDIATLLQASRAMIQPASDLLRFATKLSNEGSVGNSNPTQNRDKTPTHEEYAVIQGMRLYVRSCSIIYDTVSSGYNFTLGNVKQALTICEKAVKRL